MTTASPLFNNLLVYSPKMAGHLLQITGLPKSKKNKKIGITQKRTINESTNHVNGTMEIWLVIELKVALKAT